VQDRHASALDEAGRRVVATPAPNDRPTGSSSPAAGAAPVLRLRGIGRRFGGVHAVKHVDLEVRAGERRAILGPNGAGKTTLFNVVSGEFPPTSGRVELFGRDVTNLPARKRAKLGLTRTFQTSRLFLGLSVEDNLYLAVLGVQDGHLRPVRLPGRDGPMRDRARELAERVGLKDELGTLVGSLSHGEQRQLEVAMARAGNPRLMMLDEPAAGLSRGERVSLTQLLLDLEPDVTLILIEHDMDVALTVAERVTMMHDGRVIVEGTPAEIRASQLVHDLYLGRSHYEGEEAGG
jgi:branched-chain amino acid transport system ATP-binding protein